MILIITNSRDQTATYLAGRLVAEGLECWRLDTDLAPRRVRFGYRLASPALIVDGRVLRPGDFSCVWYRRPEPLATPSGRDTAETQHILGEWNEAVEGFLAHIDRSRWINHPAANACASHKMEQLTRAQSFGLKVPASLVTQDILEARSFWRDQHGHVVVKPLCSGFLERPGVEPDGLIYTSRVLESDLSDGGDLGSCPTFLQQLIDRECDVRVCVIDEEVVAVALRDGVPGSVDIRRDNMRGVRYEAFELSSRIEDLLVRLVASYGLRFAALDLIIDRGGQVFFLELNPNGQWAWLDLVAGFDVARLFVDAFRTGPEDH